MMKKLAMLLLVGASQLYGQKPIRNIGDLSPEETRTFMEGSRSEFVMMIPQGEPVSVHVEAHGELLHIEHREELYFIPRQTLFVQKENGQFLFSLDTAKWRPFSQFFTGSAGCSFNDGMKATAWIDVNLRQ